MRGDLGSPEALRSLLAGADAVIHAAGEVGPCPPETFARVNAGGTKALLDVIEATGSATPLLLVSSLAAGRPAVSPYAASKAEAERIALDRAHAHPLLIVRPPAVYGPGDRATMPLWAQLARGWLLAPRGPRRFSLLYVEDLARLLADLLARPWPRAAILEPDDAAPDYHDWPRAAAVASRVLGSPVRLLPLPRAAFTLTATMSGLAARWRGGRALLDPGKVAELFQREWCCRRSTMAALPWRPVTGLEGGLAATLAWYRDQGRALP